MIPRTCSGHLYEVLGVAPDASQGEIKAQYRRLALRLHPDRNDGTTTEAFQEVEEAHRVLSSPDERHVYDAFGREGMRRMGDMGIPAFMRSVRLVQPVMIGVTVFFALLLLALILISVKLDSPKARWSWAAVLTPVWLVCPIFALLGGALVAAGVKGGSAMTAIVGLEVWMLVIIPAVACAALQGSGSVTPAHAFVPCVLLYASTRLRAIFWLIPAVYAQDRREEAARARRPPQDGGDPDTQSNGSDLSDLSRSPCLSRRYWIAVTHQLLELVCVVAFICLCFARAAQGPAPLHGGDSAQRFLSFWVVFAPLIVYFGLVVSWQFTAALCGIDERSGRRLPSSSGGGDSGSGRVDEDVVIEGSGAGVAGTPPTREEPYGPYNGATHYQRYESHHRSQQGTGGDNSDSDSRSLAPWCYRVAQAVLAPFYYGCWLYMACMWAAREEVDYNHRPIESVPLYPSIYAATLPLYIALIVPTLLSCCASCVVSSVLKAAMAPPERPEESPSTLRRDTNSGNGSSNNNNNVNSIINHSRSVSETAESESGPRRTYDSTGVINRRISPHQRTGTTTEDID